MNDVYLLKCSTCGNVERFEARESSSPLKNHILVKCPECYAQLDLEFRASSPATKHGKILIKYYPKNCEFLGKMF